MAAADDFMNNLESSEAAYKTRRWLSDRPTDKQLDRLGDREKTLATSKYLASCLVGWQFNRHAVRAAVKNVPTDDMLSMSA